VENDLFNIRVYGILINGQNEVLLTDEFRFGIKMTKFPGGGLDYGEGTIDCLKRECFEEFEEEIDVTGHFYTTDFFQKSAFDDKQIISIYYRISILDFNKLKVKQNKFEFEKEQEGSQVFRWIKIDDNLKYELTFPIDKIVAGMLADQFSAK